MKTLSTSPALLDRVAIHISNHFSPKDLRLVQALMLLAVVAVVLQEVGARYAVMRAYLLRSINFSILAVIALAGAAITVLIVLLLIECVAFFADLVAGRRRNRKIVAFPYFARVSRSAGFYRFLIIAFVCAAALGAVGNVVSTAYASYRFDQPIAESRATFDDARACCDVRSIDTKGFTYCSKPDGGLSVRMTPNATVPTNGRRAIEVMEDRGAGDRIFSGNVKGIVRSIRDFLSSNDGHLQGGSSYKEQLAGQMLGLRPRVQRGLLNQLYVKFEKTLAGIRLGDLYADDDLLRMYADRVNLGSFRGYEIQGYRTGAVLYFNKEPEQLT